MKSKSKNATKKKNVLIIDPATSWHNDYDNLVQRLESEGFNVFIFGIIRYKNKSEYRASINELIGWVDQCDIILKPQDDIMDWLIFDYYSKRNASLRKVISHIKATNKILITFRADWNDFTIPSQSNIYFSDDEEKIVRNIQQLLSGESSPCHSGAGQGP